MREVSFMLHTKKGRALFALALSGVYLLLFILHYAISLLAESDLVVEISSYIVFLLMSALSALCACIFYRERGGGYGAYLWFLLFFSTRLFYQIPYYYIDYVSNYHSSGDALLLGTLMGLIDLITWYSVFVVLSFFLRRLHAGEEVGQAILCLAMPVYEFILLIVEVVLYFIKLGGMLYTDDIAYFIFGFIYPALMFAASYFGGIQILKLLNIKKTQGE